MNPPTEDRKALWSSTDRLQYELKTDLALEKCTGDAGKELLSRRRELQTELEANYHRLADLESVEMVDLIKQSALEKGLTDCLAPQNTGTCPLCLEDIPATFATRFLCCGAMSCAKCTDKRNKWVTKVREESEEIMKTIENGGNVDRFRCQDVEANLSIAAQCPFCRTEAPTEDDEDFAFCLKPSAEAGKSWAQYELGKIMMEGRPRTPKDRWKAAEWLQLAADDGNVLAMTLLAEMWGEGFPEVDIAPNKDKAKDLYQQAARQGYYLAQYHYGEMMGPGALTWYVLSAAQGFAGAQYRLGEMFYSGDPRIGHQNICKAIYWLKKAALQGDPNAQMELAGALLGAKEIVFDSRYDIVGYSAVPEACFWFDLGRKSHPAGFGHVPRPEELQLNRCGRCGVHEGVRLRACTKCQGIKYCGRDCQAAHWKWDTSATAWLLWPVARQ